MKLFAPLVALSVLTIHADAPAPQKMIFEFDLPQQQIRIGKSESAVAAAEIKLVNTFTGETVTAEKMKLSADEATGDTLLRFPAYPAGTLPDGTYRLTWANESLEFFVLAGDINRDRRVDTLDFNLLSGNFGVVAASYSNGDLNYDGTVDSKDLNIFQAQNGKSLPSPATQPATQPRE